MGICYSCLEDQQTGYPSHPAHSSDTPVVQEDPEKRRQRQAEAAIKRQKESEGRGLQHPEAVKAKQKRREEIERQAAAQGKTADTAMRWTVD